MKKEFFIFQLILCISSKLNILTSFRVLRHGARLPKRNPPKDWYTEKGYEIPHMLTKQGKNQNEQIGKKLSKFDSEYLKKDTVYYSSKSSRCIGSGVAFMKGYLKLKLKKKQMNHLPNQFFQQELTSQFKQIQIRPSLKHEIRIVEIWNELNSLGYQEILDIYQPAERKFVERSLKKKLKFMKDTYTLYVCNHANEVRIKEFTKPIRKLLKESFLLHYYYYYGNLMTIIMANHTFLKVLAIQIGEFLNENFPNIKQKLQNKFKRFYSRIQISKNMIFFGHDRNLMSIMYFFGGHDASRDLNQDFFYFVDRLSITIEVRNENYFLQKLKKQSPNPYIYEDSMRVVLRKNEKEIPIALCGFRNCSIKEFIKILQDFYDVIKIMKIQLNQKNIYLNNKLTSQIQ